MNLTWRPFEWPHFRSRSHLPAVSCVYLWTAAARDDPGSHFLYLVGETGHLSDRFSAHSTSLRYGAWNILDIEAWRRGERVVLWEGSEWSKRAHDPCDVARIREDGERMMAGVRLFIAEMPDDRRLRQRVEGAIWRILKAQVPRLCDEGMFICCRGPDEAAVMITNTVVGGRLVGLPDTMVV